jgi:hypothetical protein
MMVAIEDELSKHSHKIYFEHTINAWQYYCNKNSIDFIVVREKMPNVKYSVWHKEFVFDYVGDKYDKIGIVDFDTMIKWDAPNIFELYDDEFVGVLDQTSINWMNLSQTAYRNTFPQFKNMHVGLSEHINGGVLFFTKNHKPFFETLKQFYFDNKPVLDNWNIPNTGKEQTLLNFHLKRDGIKCKYLPYAWNTVGMIKKGLLWHNDKLNDPIPFFFKYTYIWHFTGFPIEERVQLINQIWSQIQGYYR